jgi:hypothetical protein
MINRGFVDLLFILLCSTIVLLAQSVRLEGLAADPAVAGSGGNRTLAGQKLILVSVFENHLETESGSMKQLNEIRRDGDAEIVVLVPATREISHHRIMEVWREAEQIDLDVELGVEPRGDE